MLTYIRAHLPQTIGLTLGVFIVLAAAALYKYQSNPKNYLPTNATNIQDQGNDWWYYELKTPDGKSRKFLCNLTTAHNATVEIY